MLFYISIVLSFFLKEKNLIFKRKYTTTYIPKIAKKVDFKTSDGLILEGAITKNGDNLPLVLYFSGNANNVIEFLDKIATQIKEYNFIAFNYPGYAKSEGKPCEKCILKYAVEIYDRYKPKYVIGRSLGSAVASYVGSKRDFEGILLITPFDTIECIAKRKYPFLPINLILKNRFDEYKFVRAIKKPISIIALKNDDIIPTKCLKNLIKNIPNLKNVVYLEDISHGKIYEYRGIEKIIEKLLKEFTKSNKKSYPNNLEV